MANHYRLSGHGIEVDYVIGGNPVLPALRLTDGGVTRTYLPSEITIDMTDLGTIVSVPLNGTASGNGARFGFFLPGVRVQPGQRVAVTTSGVIQTCGGTPTDRPTSWSCVHLHGSASLIDGSVQVASAA